MKILSNFSDYYDGISAYGVGDDVFYIRNETRYVRPHNKNHFYGMDKKPVSFELDKNLKRCTPSSKIVKIYFCGKVYNAYVEWNYVSNNFIYSPENVDIQNLKPLDLRYSIQELLHTNSQPKSTEVNTVFKSPIVVGYYDLDQKVIVDARLNAFQFQKIKDPYTAYMELDGFISGTFGKSCGDTVQISDKDKVHKHGFDPKYGFRKRPAGSKCNGV